ncbi:MAG: BON domain-containing protein [Verrucomicrobiota bacterium]|nr:BON domain-containing protein [Verrucomicrobiota bacterium]
MKRLTLSLLCLTAFALPALAADPKTGNTMAEKSNNTAAEAVDNTGKNTRDRSGETKTSGDQSNSPEDIKMTAAIRRAVVDDKSLSILAKNVKIITANGVVTLRGPVKTAAEKMTIGQLAMKNAGKVKIENQLEVKNSK